MYCTNCGTIRATNATTCTSCGAAIQRPVVQPAIPNYLVHSILATLCCCLPFGVVSIVYAAQVNAKLAAGDTAGAMAASRSARTWFWVAVVSGGVVSLVYAVLMMIGAMGSN